MHALISAGGLDSHGQWRNSRAGYLVPVKALQALFRGKLLHALSRALTEQRLHLPEHLPLAHWRWQIRSQYRKHWNIHLGQRYSHGRGVALYLARYVKGGPLPAQRPLQLHQQHVVLPYTDHRDGRRKRARYSVEHFIERVLWRRTARHQHLVRHCALLQQRTAASSGGREPASHRAHTRTLAAAGGHRRRAPHLPQLRAAAAARAQPAAHAPGW
ncbi:MAG: transposase [Ideonella sp.]|nr:transposase [Ideonella sp.]